MAHTKGVRPTRFSNLGTPSSPTFQTLGWILGFGNYMLAAIGLRNEACPVHAIVCTGYRERQAYYASRGATMPGVLKHLAKGA